MRLWIRRLLIITLCVFVCGIPARAQTALSPAQAYAVLMQLGRRALSQADPQKATGYFSKALQIAPDDPAAQLSLAEAFARQGQVRRSEAFLRFLLKDPQQQAHVAYYLKGLRELQLRHPFVASASFAALPSTNIKNSSSKSVFDTLLGRFQIDDGGVQTSGVGADVGVQALYRRPLEDGQSLEIGASLNRIWYASPELRFWRGRLSADLVSLEARQQLRFGLHTDRLTYSEHTADDNDQRTTGLHAVWSRDLSQGAQIGVSGLAEYRQYLNKDQLSGPFASLALTWSTALTGDRRLRLGASVDRARPELEYHRYWGGSLRAGYETALSDTLRAEVSLSAALRAYDTDFAAVDYARRDEIYRFGLSLSDSRLKIMGSTPTLSCGYRLQNSNIALYATRSTDCRIGFSYRF